MSFWKPTVKLRKLFRSKVTFATALVFLFVVLLRSGIITMKAWQNDEESQGVHEVYKTNAELFSNLAKPMKTAQERLSVVNRPSKMFETKNDVVSLTEKDSSVHYNKKTSYYKETKHRISFIELVDQVNPSHSIKNDRNYRANDLKQLVQGINENQFIMNREKFPHRDKNGVIIVVQVHKRLEYLIALLSSLEQAKGIEKSLLIISSDWYSDSIVEVVKKIKFCQVKHFYQHSPTIMVSIV